MNAPCDCRGAARPPLSGIIIFPAGWGCAGRKPGEVGVRRRYAIVASVLLLALAAVTADGRRSPSPLVSAVPVGASAIQVSQRGPVVAPVRRRMPETPPFPEAILLAGDVVEPSRAPDDAPDPSRRDAALAAIHLAADQAARSSVTITAQEQGGQATTAE